MATTYAVTGWQNINRLALAVVAVLFSAAFAGCGTTSILGTSGGTGSTTTATATPSPSLQPAPVSRKTVALANVVGAPEGLGNQIKAQLAPALQQQQVSVAQAGRSADYTLRGYMVAAKEKTGVKVSYIWDLVDSKGKRVNRIQGEELARGGSARDPWSAVTPQLTQAMASKVSGSLAQAMAKLAPPPRSKTPVGIGAPPAVASAARPINVASAAAARGSSAVGSIVRSSRLSAVVPRVAGAPGDGNAALTNAMRQKLQGAGIAIGQPGQRNYAVAGKVTMGRTKNGRQPIKIDWKVTDPNGIELATVTQNNEIAAGSLNGAWGNVAHDAAQGAAVKIKSLIEENRRASAAASRTTARRSRG